MPALVSEQLARRLKLAVGDRIEVPAPGGNWPLEVVGIYADYGNPKGQIAVNFAALTRRFPEIPLTRMGLRVAPPKIPALISALQEKFGLDDRNVADQATMKAESTRIFNRTFAVTAALNAFTLGVAGIALLTSLLTLANSRLPQLAPLWAIGITRRRLAGDRTAEDDVGGADHRAAGAAARACWWRGACSRSSTSRRSAGGCRFTSSRCNCSELLGVAMAAALLAALLPVIRLARMQPASLIRIFANER